MLIKVKMYGVSFILNISVKYVHNCENRLLLEFRRDGQGNGESFLLNAKIR